MPWLDASSYGNRVFDTGWYADATRTLRDSGLRWISEERWRDLPPRHHRLADFCARISDYDYTSFYAGRRPHVVYCLLRLDGCGKVYVGSTISAMFGSANNDRLRSHLRHLQKHYTRTCHCRHRLYSYLGSIPLAQLLVLPLVILQSDGEHILRRAEKYVIRSIQPVLNTMGTPLKRMTLYPCHQPRRRLNPRIRSSSLDRAHHPSPDYIPLFCSRVVAVAVLVS